MVEILVDESIKNLAIEHSAERMQYEYNRFGFNNEKRKNMILVGTIGQLIFNAPTTNWRYYTNESIMNGDSYGLSGTGVDSSIMGSASSLRTYLYANKFLKCFEA